ncbi:MAG: nucleoside hydrolase [Chloroflexi bacterium]|nr:MAG: nucleoside hydrolase [Chloroflexota bacterium]
MHRIILDTDPGIDDALALFLALSSPEVRLEAITTVGGNVNVNLTTHNALALLELAGRTDIPVARGSNRPIVRQPIFAEHVHGDNGLGGLQLPEPPIKAIASHAVDVIIEKIMASPGEITLVPIGPLTNIALALRRETRIAQSVREVVIMGGALRVPGNTTPSAEFNIYVDPHAAHMVLHAGWPIRLVSLDTTMQAELRRDQVEILASSDNPVTSAIRQMLTYYFDVFGPQNGISAFHMHDPLCLVAAFQPDLISWEPAFVDVELNGTLTLGETVAYFGPLITQSPNVLASVGVDAERFIQLFLQRIKERFA